MRFLQKKEESSPKNIPLQKFPRLFFRKRPPFIRSFPIFGLWWEIKPRTGGLFSEMWRKSVASMKKYKYKNCQTPSVWQLILCELMNYLSQVLEILKQRKNFAVLTVATAFFAVFYLFFSVVFMISFPVRFWLFGFFLYIAFVLQWLFLFWSWFGLL